MSAKEYSNGEVIVIWKAELCTHASYCWKELPEVFDPNARPWVNMKGASTERIIQQVNRCPSGALTYRMESEKKENNSKEKELLKMQVLPNGPLIATGEFILVDKHGKSSKTTDTTAFCRCGASKNKPFCDGSHIETGFKDE